MIKFSTKWLGWLCKWQGLPSWVAGLRLRRKALLWWWWLYPWPAQLWVRLAWLCGWLGWLCGCLGCLAGWLGCPPAVLVKNFIIY